MEIAIVTGASAGIGAEFARQLSSRGMPVLAVARRRERLDGLAEAAQVAKLGEIVPLALDLTAPDAAEQIRAQARAMGRVAWVVNDAGTLRIGAAARANPSEQAEMVRLNCEAVVRLTTTLLPELVAQRSGRILNVASVAAFQPTPFQAVYGATKAFVLSYTEALHEELRGTGVSVTALCPGPVTTEIFDAAATGVAREKPGYEITAAECARFGLDEAERGRVIAVPGALQKMMIASGRFSPRALLRRVSGMISVKYLGYDPRSF